MTDPQGTGSTSTSALREKREAISVWHHLREADAVRQLVANIALTSEQRVAIERDAALLVERCREQKHERPLVDRFLNEYGLSNEEGVALLCLVEALLRIPDDDTATLLIEERIGHGAWERHIGRSDSLFVNASTWALLLTGSMLELSDELVSGPFQFFRQLWRRLGEAVTLQAMRTAVGILSREFIAGETIERGVARSAGKASFDVLGEAARTAAVAEGYFNSYAHALSIVDKAAEATSHTDNSSVSIKLSALHPRVEPLKSPQVAESLAATVLQLLDGTSSAIHVTIDSEEASRTEVLLDTFERVARQRSAHQAHIGIAVQAYSKRAFAILDWLAALARETQQQFPVRLVKGAYWDTEIKYAQQRGFASYPVFTRKSHTDISYLACAERLFRHLDVLLPQIATHNAHSLVALHHLGASDRFEFQRLHGMGELLYAQAAAQFPDLPACRVYAPVGPPNELMAYLTRRLLENGANSSFVNRFLDAESPAATVVTDPLRKMEEDASSAGEAIPLPLRLYEPERQNSVGEDLGDPQVREALLDAIRRVPQVNESPPDLSVSSAFDRAAASFGLWAHQTLAERTKILHAFASRLKQHRVELIALLQDEACKTLEDSIDELREAEDLVRYYAAQAHQLLRPMDLPSPTGEHNQLRLVPRGVFGCISPWNFPVAIFLGQITAALATGNTVVAKPAPQTPRIAARLVELFDACGLPDGVLSCVYGDIEVGRAIVRHDALAGVVFTGSIQAAKDIQRQLAQRNGPILPLIAETGGINAMVVDSSALLEATVDDICQSAFGSAGQRCSALRLLCVTESIAQPLLGLLTGAMDALKVGDPADPGTDIGPLIDAEAVRKVRSYLGDREILHVTQHNSGSNFVAPTLVKAASIEEVQEEIFGPVLHVYSYSTETLEQLIGTLNQKGFGLTFGIQSRLDSHVRRLRDTVRAGNIYINRGMTGAAVGTQPFGGEGLSGTGPKAGGPYYLQRFVTEQVTTNNVVATGGNFELLRLNL